MKLAILSRNSKLYSTRRLVEAARARGHTVRILDPLRCYMRINAGDFSMHYKGRPLSGFDAVIPRIGASITRYGTAVLRQFEMMGTRTPNPSDAAGRLFYQPPFSVCEASALLASAQIFSAGVPRLLVPKIKEQGQLTLAIAVSDRNS